jgi:cell division protein FtsL
MLLQNINNLSELTLQQEKGTDPRKVHLSLKNCGATSKFCVNVSQVSILIEIVGMVENKCTVLKLEGGISSITKKLTRTKTRNTNYISTVFKIHAKLM